MNFKKAYQTLVKYTLFAAVLCGVVGWQLSVGLNSKRTEVYRGLAVYNTLGVMSDPEHVFTYGLYYWGLFPLYPDRRVLPDKFFYDDYFYSRKGAADILANHGGSLKMDIYGSHSAATLPLA